MNDEPSFHEAAEELASGMARICRLYGVAPIVGRLYAALFVATRPLSLDELCERVGAAKSTTSVALQKLVRAHVARRLPPRGDRRDYFEAVTDPWAVIADWNRLYFTPELEMFRETGHALEVSLDGRDAPAKEDVSCASGWRGFARWQRRCPRCCRRCRSRRRGGRQRGGSR
ncbi:MAG: hypothetical protein R3F14_36905 [Polyangiaceae bacterium]